MARQIAVIGLGAFGEALSRTLGERGVEVIAIDSSREHTEAVKDCVAAAITLDATDERALRAIGLENVDAAVVAIGQNVEANLLATALLKKMGVKNIMARATNPLQERIIRAIGVTRVINLEHEMGVMMANSLALPHIERTLPLATGHSVAEVITPPSFVGKSLLELDLRNRYRVNLIAIKRREPDVNDQGERITREVINDIPQSTDVLHEGDLLVLVGTDDVLEALPQK